MGYESGSGAAVISRSRGRFGRKRIASYGFSLLLASAAGAQTIISPAVPGGSVQLITSDLALLEAQENRKDLPCTVTPSKANLGFDLKFHAGYEVSLNLKDLAGADNLLSMVFRVTPDGHSDQAVHFSQHVSVPMIDEDDRGPAYVNGLFDVGEGKYHVDWLLRDRSERVCSFHWDTEAVVPLKDKPMPLEIAAGAVQAADSELFRQEPPVLRNAKEEPLRVKVIVNFAPQDSGASTIQPPDANALVAILRNISRDPRIGSFSVVAYNMQEQKVLYRQDPASQIDFPALGKSVNKLNLGTVDLKHLLQKHGESEFLSNLLTSEVKDAKDANQEPDAVIFTGPKVMLDDGLPPETLKQLSEVKFPMFYMNYNLYPQTNPWRDAIGNAVRAVKGVEYTISRPRDMFFAWSEIMGHIVKLKLGRSGSGNTSQ